MINYDSFDIKKCAKLVFLFILFLSMIYILEQSHLLHATVMDDLNLGKFFFNSSMKDIMFGGYKFRPISQGAIWLAVKICKGNLYWYGYLNIILAAGCALLIYYLIERIIHSDFFAS